MKFQLWHGQIEKLATDCIIIGIYHKNKFLPTTKIIDTTTKGTLSQLAKTNDLPKKSGQSLMLHQLDSIKSTRVLIVHAGKDEHLSLGEFVKVIADSIRPFKESNVEKILFCLTELPVKDLNFADKIQKIVEIIEHTLYDFNQYRSEKKSSALKSIELFVPDKAELKSAEKALKQGLAIAKGVHFTRDLANQPANVCNPTWVATEATKLAKAYPAIKITILEEKDMRRLGMGAFLAVAAGSNQDAKFICLEYTGSTKKSAPTVLVGKGITFDSGGLSLKPADAMVGMKYDMCGAATVLGTLKAAAELKLPTHLVGLLALAENMPSGTATRPEDIVTSLSGQTIEILNTDAEGRLVLCDALTYAERYKPKAVIDIATLTGAAVIALGHHATALLSNHQPLADALLAAGIKTHDRVWQLPLWEEYQEQLKSPFADMSNVGGRPAGTITAACFLSRFAKKYHWAHLDVAGTAASMFGNDRYSTGRPVPLLIQYLMDQIALEK